MKLLDVLNIVSQIISAEFVRTMTGVGLVMLVGMLGSLIVI